MYIYVQLCMFQRFCLALKILKHIQSQSHYMKFSVKMGPEMGQQGILLSVMLHHSKTQAVNSENMLRLEMK